MFVGPSSLKEPQKTPKNQNQKTHTHTAAPNAGV